MAGKQAGFAEDSGTRSSLLWQVKRLLLECQEIGELPQCLVMENVEALVNKKNMPDFQKWLDFLDSMGYKSYWNKMNSKDFGVAQNRSRILCVSLLSDLPYIFPEPIPLKKRLKDVLEKNVDEKFYINNEKAQKLIVELIDKGVLPESKCGIDLSTRGTDKREVANAIKTAQRGIVNFAQAETGIVESSSI